MSRYINTFISDSLLQGGDTFARKFVLVVCPLSFSFFLYGMTLINFTIHRYIYFWSIFTRGKHFGMFCSTFLHFFFLSVVHWCCFPPHPHMYTDAHVRTQILPHGHNTRAHLCECIQGRHTQASKYLMEVWVSEEVRVSESAIKKERNRKRTAKGRMSKKRKRVEERVRGEGGCSGVCVCAMWRSSFLLAQYDAYVCVCI